MTKAELVAAIGKEVEISRAAAEKALNELFKSVVRASKNRDKVISVHPVSGFQKPLSNSLTLNKDPRHLSADTGLDLKPQLYVTCRFTHESEETPKASVQDRIQEDLAGLPPEVSGKEPGHSGAARCYIHRRYSILRDLLPLVIHP
jgi:hypothetical protein